MTKVTYLPRVPEEPRPASAVTQWSFGIAMFAAFVIPFVLLVSSARYRGFVDQASHKIGLSKLQPASSTENESAKAEKFQEPKPFTPWVGKP